MKYDIYASTDPEAMGNSEGNLIHHDLSVRELLTRFSNLGKKMLDGEMVEFRLGNVTEYRWAEEAINYK